MAEIARTPSSASELGLLPHEARFVLHALRLARVNLVAANQVYSDAVAESGGDWAFDDPGARDAAMAGAQRDEEVALFEELKHVAETAGIVPYPNVNLSEVAIGTRIVVDDSGEVYSYDVVTRAIRGIPTEDGVSLVSAQTPLGTSLVGATEGRNVNYTLPNGRSRTIAVAEIDQTAQMRFYDALAPDEDIEALVNSAGS